MERVLSMKANWLVEHGYEVVLVTTEQHGRQPFFPLDSRIRCIDLPIGYEDNNGSSLLNKIVNYPLKQRRHRWALTSLLLKEHPDVTVSMFCNDADFITSIPDGSKKVLEVHFSRFKRLQYQRRGLWGVVDSYRSKREVKIAKGFDRFVVLTEQDRAYWGALPNISVIPNASPITAATPSTLMAKKVIAVGRLDFQKGFDRLLQAWNLIVKDYPDWHLDIIGEGSDRRALQEQISLLGVENSVSLRGEIKEVEDCYRDASIIAMTSRYEGLPMALIEAQAMGLPAVAMDCKCGPREIVIDGRNGYLVAEGDIPEMAHRLRCLMASQGLRQMMGRSAHHDSHRFALEAIMGRWTSLFASLAQ